MIKTLIFNFKKNLLFSGGLTVQQVVDRVMKDLTPTVIEVVRVTVRGNSEFDLSSSAARGKLVLR